MRRPRRRQGMLAFWTIQRATAVGIVAGLSALIVSALIGGWPGALLDAYAGLLALHRLLRRLDPVDHPARHAQPRPRRPDAADPRVRRRRRPCC